MKPQNVLTDHVTDDCCSVPRFQMSGRCGFLRRRIPFLWAPHRLPEILHLHQRQTASLQLRWGLRLQQRYWRLRWHRERHQLVSTTCMLIEMSRNRCTDLDRFPGGSDSLDFQDTWHIKVVSLSVLRTGRLYPRDIFLVLIFSRGWVDLRDMVRSERNMSMKKPVTLPGNLRPSHY
jgi:hypothetical protein